MNAYVRKGSSRVRPTLLEGGEIVDQIISDLYIPKFDLMSFVRYYQNPLPNGIKGNDALLLLWIIIIFKKNDPIISLSKYSKDQIQEQFGWSLSTLDRAIANLKKLNIIFRIELQSKKSAMYMINPEIMWNGDDATRMKTLTSHLKAQYINNMPDKEKEAIAAANKYQEVMEKDQADSVSKFVKEHPKTAPKFRFAGIKPIVDIDNLKSFFQKKRELPSRKEHFTEEDNLPWNIEDN